jgi:hypothetical protein
MKHYDDMELELLKLGDTIVETDSGERQVILWAEIQLGAALERVFTDAMGQWRASTPTTITIPTAGVVAWPWATPHIDGRQELPAVFVGLIPFCEDVVREGTSSYGPAQITTLTPQIISNTWRRLAQWAEDQAAAAGDTGAQVCWMGVAAGAAAMQETAEFLARAGDALVRDSPGLKTTIRRAMAAGLL